jgi:regulator of sirC expression with transglutaminase-like and TPR domain
MRILSARTLVFGAFVLPLFLGCEFSARSKMLANWESATSWTLEDPPALPPFVAPNPNNTPRTFEQLIRLPDGQFDLAEAVTALGEETQPIENNTSDVNDAAGRRLKILQAADAWGARLAADLPENPESRDIVESLRDVFFQGFVTEPVAAHQTVEYGLESFFFHRRGNCLTAGVAALAAARRAGVSLYGAQCPGHFFLRWVGPPDERGRRETRNFDITLRELVVDDEFYRRRRGFDERAEKVGAYLKPLGDRQVLAIWLASRSGRFCAENLPGRALRDAERALKLDPKNIPAWLNRGTAAAALKRLDEARDAWLTALTLNPNEPQALVGLAALHVADAEHPLYDPTEARRRVEAASKALGERRLSSAAVAPLRRRKSQTLDDDVLLAAYVAAVNAEVYAVEGKWRAAVREMQMAANVAPDEKKYVERLDFFRRMLRERTEQGREGSFSGFGLRP